ncbi:MAG TPA: hypothetical protein PLM24_01735 [Methanothrix sp.]|nr:hypothetical protein [Methanothrix sp.]HPJ84315.1 hypothetical protein [Methanothrix sp.]HPR65840.1 hypothetical protein [Methanothrix sp.]
MRWLFALILISILATTPAAEALEFVSDDVVSINSPVEDDLFASGSTVNINAPVDSAIIAGGNVNVDAPIKGDLIVAGGDVSLNSEVGGKIVAAGGTINLRGDVERNVVMAGGTVRILPSSEIGKDAAISGGDVYNGGNVTGTLWVNAGNFNNTGTAGDVKFQQWQEDKADEEKAKAFISTFSVLMILGFLIVGLIILRLFPGSVSAVDKEIRESPPVKALLGLGLIVASMILIIISILTVVGLPLGFLLLTLFVAALMMANLFVSFSLGRWILSALNQTLGDLPAFVLGYVVLSVLFLLPYAGPIIELISISLGFGAMVYALNESRRRV